MNTQQPQPEARYAMVLGWTLNELLGRYNHYLHPDSPTTRPLTRGRLPPLTYSVQEEMARNTDQAFACALRLGVLVDALGFEDPERSELKQQAHDLAAAIRTYQRTRGDQPALGTTRFWPILDDFSWVTRVKLYSIQRPIEVCFRFAGALAALYWLFPVDDAGRPIDWRKQFARRYRGISLAISLLNDLGDFLPASLTVPLLSTMEQWRYLTYRLKRVGKSLTQEQARIILEALGKQSENWEAVVLGEKETREYLTPEDQGLVHLVSLLVSGILLLTVVLTLAVLLPPLWSSLVSIALPQVSQVPLSQWFDSTTKLSTSDLLTVASALGAVMTSAAVAAVWCLRRLEYMRQIVFNWAATELAARRMLVLPQLSYPYSWVLSAQVREGRSEQEVTRLLDRAAKRIIAGEYPLSAIPSRRMIARLIKDFGQKYGFRLDDLQSPQLIAELIREWGFGLQDLTDQKLKAQVQRLLQPRER